MAQPLEGFGPPEVEGFGPPEEPRTSGLGAFVTHAVNAGIPYVPGWISELSAAGRTLQDLPWRALHPEDYKNGIVPQFKEYEGQMGKYLAQGEREHPVLSNVGTGVGGTLSALTSLPRKAAGLASEAIEQAPSFLEKLVEGIKSGTAYGVSTGLGESKADLTRGSKQDVTQAFYDMLKGGGEGAAIGGGTTGVMAGGARTLAAASPFLEKIGLSKLTKAAVGRSAKAYRLLNQKNLAEGAPELLDRMGIGVGDSTESIVEKLGQQGDKLRGTMDNTIKKVVGRGNVYIPAEEVARHIEAAAQPLNYEATQAEYQAAMAHAARIREKYKNAPPTLEQAIGERQAAQKKANYDRQSQVGNSEFMKDVARAWNDTIDNTAEPFLERQGMDSRAFRQQRHDYSLVAELHGDALENLYKQQAHDPGFLAEIGGHIPRTYGKAAIGRTALNMSRSLSGAPASADRFADFLRGAAQSPLSEQDQSK